MYGSSCSCLCPWVVVVRGQSKMGRVTGPAYILCCNWDEGVHRIETSRPCDLLARSFDHPKDRQRPRERETVTSEAFSIMNQRVQIAFLFLSDGRESQQRAQLQTKASGH